MRGQAASCPTLDPAGSKVQVHVHPQSLIWSVQHDHLLYDGDQTCFLPSLSSAH